MAGGVIEHRPISLPAGAANLLEAWIRDKRTGYVQLNFTEGTIGNATIHCTVPIQGAKHT